MKKEIIQKLLLAAKANALFRKLASEEELNEIKLKAKQECEEAETFCIVHIITAIDKKKNITEIEKYFENPEISTIWYNFAFAFAKILNISEDKIIDELANDIILTGKTKKNDSELALSFSLSLCKIFLRIDDFAHTIYANLKLFPDEIEINTNNDIATRSLSDLVNSRSQFGLTGLATSINFKEEVSPSIFTSLPPISQNNNKAKTKPKNKQDKKAIKLDYNEFLNSQFNSQDFGIKPDKKIIKAADTTAAQDQTDTTSSSYKYLEYINEYFKGISLEFNINLEPMNAVVKEYTSYVATSFKTCTANLTSIAPYFTRSDTTKQTALENNDSEQAAFDYFNLFSEAEKARSLKICGLAKDAPDNQDIQNIIKQLLAKEIFTKSDIFYPEPDKFCAEIESLEAQNSFNWTPVIYAAAGITLIAAGFGIGYCYPLLFNQATRAIAPQLLQNGAPQLLQNGALQLPQADMVGQLIQPNENRIITVEAQALVVFNGLVREVSAGREDTGNEVIGQFTQIIDTN